jgi:SAM-dependent methyltransferase
MGSYKYYASLLRHLPRAAFRRLTCERCRGYLSIRKHVEGKDGLEIGGPSRIFAKDHLIPVYNICRSIDECNFSEQTIWSNSDQARKIGVNVRSDIVLDASMLSSIPDQSYEFVLASHVLEHIANPLRALEEWKRVLKVGGMLLAVVPRKNATFDHKRPFTSFDHIEADFVGNTSEDDLTHVDEILRLHDLEMDPPAGSWQRFRERCFQNPSIRAMHHHVFSPSLLISMFTKSQMRMISLSAEHPCHLVVAAERVGSEMAEGEDLKRHNSQFALDNEGERPAKVLNR